MFKKYISRALNRSCTTTEKFLIIKLSEQSVICGSRKLQEKKTNHLNASLNAKSVEVPDKGLTTNILT